MHITYTSHVHHLTQHQVLIPSQSPPKYHTSQCLKLHMFPLVLPHPIVQDYGAGYSVHMWQTLYSGAVLIPSHYELVAPGRLPR